MQITPSFEGVASQSTPQLDHEKLPACWKFLLSAPNTRGAQQAFRLHPDLAIVLLPGEVFADLGLGIKKASPFRHTLVIELSNDTPAYIPNEQEFREGSYETVNSRIAPGGGERLAEATLRLLKELDVQ